MAKVWYRELGVGANLDPGATHHWWWNNAPAKRVWAASLDVWRAKGLLSGDPRMEITRVEYRSRFEDFSLDPSEMEVHFWVKNTGNVKANYRINLSAIGK
jgi:hypothetical protein